MLACSQFSAFDVCSASELRLSKKWLSARGNSNNRSVNQHRNVECDKFAHWSSEQRKPEP